MALSWISHIIPALIFLIAFILIYIAFKKMKVPGSDFILAILAGLLAILMVSSDSLIDFTSKFISYISVVLIATFCILLSLVFTTKDTKIFESKLSWITFTIVIALAVLLAFNFFPAIYHMLPGTSDSSLSHQFIEIKDLIYKENFISNFVFIASAIAVGFVLVKK